MRFQKRNRERVNVYLDGSYAFPVTAITAARLRIGQSLSDTEIAGLSADDAAQRAYERALRYLASRPRSVVEVRDLLAGNQDLLPETVDAVLERLLQAGYLDDVAFARYWIANREQFRPRAPLALRQELRQKGVAPAVIAAALQDIDAHASALRAGLAQVRRYTALDHAAFRQKLGGYLLRRGFSHEVVWPTVDRLWQDLQMHEQID
ncbi:MAG: RecX family transcriptional regulator [Caldilineales bacterium]